MREDVAVDHLDPETVSREREKAVGHVRAVAANAARQRDRDVRIDRRNLEGRVEGGVSRREVGGIGRDAWRSGSEQRRCGQRDPTALRWDRMAAKTQPARSFEELWQALVEVPEGLIGEIVDGAVRTNPRPGPPHVEASSGLGIVLGGPFQFGFGGGPGGWVILDEPRVRFGDECRVPDIAGWRRDRYTRPETGPYEVIPDWICELLSTSTAVEDRTEKLPLYAKHGVNHVWVIDAIAQTLEVLRLEGGRWVVAQTFGGDAKVRAEPFGAIEIDLALLWGPRTAPDDGP